MSVKILSQENSVIHQYMQELRDVEIQKDSMRFRKNIERVGQIIAYEISKELTYFQKQTQTPFGICNSKVLKEHPVVINILRSGLSMHQGFLSVFDHSESGFISAYRKHNSDGSYVIVSKYFACPNITNRTVILLDPMLATGKSIETAMNAINANGKPSKIMIACLLGSKEGVAYIQNKFPQSDLWIAEVDNDLSDEKYILPGMGDAGDLSFGEKL
jgi:uracil phosphoribosyltransferase